MGLIKLPDSSLYTSRNTVVSPFQPMEIDFSHPLTKGLVAVIYRDRDLLSGLKLRNVLPVEITPDGEMYGYGDGVQKVVTLPEPVFELTLLTRVRAIDSLLSGFIDFFTTSENGSVRSRIRSSGNTLTFGASLETIQFDVGVFSTPLDNVSFDIAMRGDDARSEGFGEANYVEPSWSGASVTLDPWNEFNVVGSTFNASRLYAPYCYVYDIALSREDCEHVLRNPYEMLKPAKSIVYFTSSVAGPVTGSVAVVEEDDVLSATGSVISTITGSIAVVEEDDILLSTGTVLSNVTGSVAVVEEDDVLLATGSVFANITGSIAVVEEDDILLSTGTVLSNVTGSIAVVEENDTFVSIGLVSSTILGTISVVEQDDVFLANGSIGIATGGENDISLSSVFNFGDINVTEKL